MKNFSCDPVNKWEVIKLAWHGVNAVKAQRWQQLWQILKKISFGGFHAEIHGVKKITLFVQQIFTSFWHKKKEKVSHIGLCGVIRKSAFTSLTPANPNCACLLHPHICGLQRTPWRRLVCCKIKHSEHVCAFLWPTSSSLLLWRDTSLSLTSPQHSLSCLCHLHCVFVGVLFLCSKEAITASALSTNTSAEKPSEALTSSSYQLWCNSANHFQVSFS